MAGLHWRLVLSLVALALAACGGGESADSTAGGGGASSGGASTGGASSGGAAGAGGGGGTAGTGALGGTSAGGSGGQGGSGGSTCAAKLPSPTVVDVKTATEIVVVGDPGATEGIFDPSIEYPAGAPGGAMSYSAVQAKSSISTRIAVSPDKGATWTYVASPNAAVDITVTAQPSHPLCSGSCKGLLIQEVSSLVYDADDPDTARRWKLFAHAYVVVDGGALAYDLGYISLFTAPEPLGPWKDEGKTIGWSGLSELSSKDAGTLATSLIGTKDCLALTEPGALWRNGGLLDLAVGCVGPDLSIRIELLRSFDHAKTWLYSARLLSAQDALCLGASVPQINAADLFGASGKTWLLATPAGPVPQGGTGYRGCLLFEVGAGGGGVIRDVDGVPEIKRFLDAADGRFSGACTAAEGASAHGYLMSELSLETTPKIFRVFASGQAPP